MAGWGGSFPGQLLPYIADGALPSKRVVMMSSVAPSTNVASPGGRRAKLTTGSTAASLGITTEDKVDGDPITVQVAGVALGMAGTVPIVPGDRLTCDAAGKLVPIVLAPGVNVQFVGIAQIGATVVDQDVEVLLTQSLIQGA